MKNSRSILIAYSVGVLLVGAAVGIHLTPASTPSDDVMSPMTRVADLRGIGEPVRESVLQARHRVEVRVAGDAAPLGLKVLARRALDRLPEAFWFDVAALEIQPSNFPDWKVRYERAVDGDTEHLCTVFTRRNR